MDAETSRQIADLRTEIADARAKMAGLLGRAGGYVVGQVDLNGWLQLWKQSSVGTPGTDKVRITVVDKAGGESVVAIFDDGSTIELASQGSGIGPHAMAIHTDEDTWHAGLTGASLHNPKAHTLVSSTHTASGLTEGYTIRATGATTFAWQQLQHNDLGGVTANQHHSQQHVITGSDHTASGLTAGHVIRATGATSFAWQQLQHNDLGGIGASDHHNPVTAGNGIAVTGQQVAVDLVSPSGLSFAAGKLQLDDSVAGSGLTITDKVLAIGAGNGITVTADAVAVDLASQSGLAFESGKLAINKGNGLAISGNVLQHDSGSFGDLHWNYAETGYAETITGAWTFEATLTARDILPDWTDSYDIGSSTKLWRKGWFSELDSILFAQQTITLIGGWFSLVKYASTVNEDVTDSDTSIDFGTDSIPPNMNANDFVIFRRFGAVEYMQLVSHSGSGVWTVTRNVDGSGANTWAKGSPFANYGYDGTGRIDLDAQTGGPRLSILQQGTSYNAFTERVRIGDLNGWGPFSSMVYGWAAGSYAGNEYAYYAPTTGMKIRGTVTADDGTLVNLSVTGTLTLSGSGKLITAASPNPRIELTTTLLAGYSDATTKQFYIQASDGKAYAGGGKVTLDTSGLTIIATSNFEDIRAYRFTYGAGGPLVAALDCRVASDVATMRLRVPKTASSTYGTLSLQVDSDSYSIIELKTMLDGGIGPTFALAKSNASAYAILEQVNYFEIQTDIRMSGGISVGDASFDPGAGDVGYTANLRPIRGGTLYTGRALTHYGTASGSTITLTGSWQTILTATQTVPADGGILYISADVTWYTSAFTNRAGIAVRLVVDGSEVDYSIDCTTFQYEERTVPVNWCGSVDEGSKTWKVEAQMPYGTATIQTASASSRSKMAWALYC